MAYWEAEYDGSLESLYYLLSITLEKGETPGRLYSSLHRIIPNSAEDNHTQDLFAPSVACESIQQECVFLERIQGAEFELRAASSLAHDDFIHAWMSELPVEREILAFAAHIIWASKRARINSFQIVEAARTDRGNRAVLATLTAADKARHEIHRMMGFLRFRESNSSRLVAFCEPDHAIIAALGAHFYTRFGLQSWAICDLRRLTALVCDPPVLPNLVSFEADDSEFGLATAMSDEWERLWQGYHASISIENRTNQRLQRQLMPIRYWKYLTELYDGAALGGA